MRYFFTTLWLFSILLQLNGQETDKIFNNLYQQIRIFPQEKVYLTTDKAAYVAGEYIWFRAFLTDALTHRTDIPQSRYVYVDLIDPDGSILKHYKIRPDSNGIFHNHIDLDKEMAEGTYLIRAYTAYMRSIPDYLFEKKVFIADLQSSVIEIKPEFTVTQKGEVSVLFRFRNLKDSSFFSVETIKISLGKSALKEFPARHLISFRANPEKDKHLYITFAYSGKQYRKYIAIPYPGDSTFDVSFYPEGGWLIDETPCKVGFKALRNDGLSEKITGSIYDSNDSHIVDIESIHAGMGSFMLIPETGKSYYALCMNQDSIIQRFELPAARVDAYTLRLFHQKEQMVITAQGNRQSQDGDLFLIVHIRGMVLYADKMPQNNLVILQSANLPSGIIQALLLDSAMNPLSERLIFNRQHDFVKAEITPDQTDYGRRSLVKMGIVLKAPEGYDTNSFFAVSVTDDGDIQPDINMTIASYLLLSSELRGYIEEAGYYMGDDPDVVEALDALMLSQGWRRYDIPSVVKGILEVPDSYIEGGQEFSGSVKEVLLGRAVQNGSVWVMAHDTEFIKEVKTDQSGRFYITGFEFPDSTRYTLFAGTQKDRRVELSLDPELPLLPTKSVTAQPKKVDKPLSDLIAKANQRFIEEQGMRSYEIPETVITAKKREEEGRSVFSSEIIQRTIPQDIIEKNPLDIVRMLKLSPHLKVGVEPMTSNATVYIGRGQALIVIDDIPMQLGYNIDNLTGIPIKRIEILKPPISYIFGIEGMAGAVLITTEKGGEYVPKPTPHIASVTPLGYKRTVTFYSPKYETDVQRNNPKPDLRTTIYWKPDVQIIDGAAYIEFYTADAVNTIYSVVLEGITPYGEIIRQTGRINITQ